MSSTRQLAAIMFADIVGYTTMMQQNEAAALEILNHFKEDLNEKVNSAGGKIIQYYGDGCLAIFSNPTDAVQCAMTLQEIFRTQHPVPVRIGIHLGEILVEDGNIFGDSVNIASRIQSMSVPGGILFSDSIKNQVKNKPEFQFTSLGRFEFKNVEERIEVFALTNEGLSVPLRNKLEGKLKKKNAKKRNILLTLSLVIIIAAAFFAYKKYFTKTDAAADKSIAVLPFVDMSAAKDQEYFSDGLSEELLNLLTKIPELKVIGRSSSFSFKGKNEDLRSIADKLGVAHILEGSVRKDGNNIRVTAQLIKANDGSHLWSETYDRNLEGLFKLQDEIAGAVVKQLKLKLLAIPSTTASSNFEVHNLILQGNYFYDKLDKENVAKAIDFYNQALAIDSNDARAWGKLANAISRQSWQNYIEQNTGYEKARHAALKAISLDSTLAIGYLELADIKLYHDFDWHGAEQEYQKALSLEPGNSEIIYGIGDLYQGLGRWQEAVINTKQTIVLDPLKPLYYLNLGSVQTYAGQLKEGNLSYKKALDLDPRFQRAHMYQGRNYLLIGKPDLALKEMQLENNELFKYFGLTLVYHALGRKQDADEKLKEFKEKYQDNWSYLVAQVHAFRNEKDEAFAWLETAYNKKDSWLYWVKGDPLLKNLKTDPRYNAFLKKMNLPTD
jgi:TolB-like protein/class 3 adenylate cyclase/Tfp pilus assembly protein PilF